MGPKKSPRSKPLAPLARQLGAVIRQARESAGLSQDELAWQCGVHRAYMGFVEQGRYRISVEKLVQVCTGLKIKPSELLARIDL